MPDPPSTTNKDAPNTSYTSMSSADVEAIGAHCQMPFCHQLDFLPFRCESCRGNFCLDHRSETAHSCTQAGAWARQRREREEAARGGGGGGATTRTPVVPKPHILHHESQCAQPACKTLIHTALVTGVHCDTCRRDYCLKHRFGQDHDCAKLEPLGKKAAGGGGVMTQKERGLAALEKLRLWGASKKSSTASSSSSAPSSKQTISSSSTLSASSFLPQSKTKQSAAAALAATQALKRSAKGDPKTPPDQRIHLYIEASASSDSKQPRKDTFFYARTWRIGRILDAAAKSLQVENLNNRVEGEEERLRVFWVEGGRLLAFGETLEEAKVRDGNTLVLIRGVGVGMVGTPEGLVEG
jgi:predicted nucleic acid binding AN1-type Zn finger protein